MKHWLRILIYVLVGVIVFGFFVLLFFPWKSQLEVKYTFWLPKNYYGENSYSQQNELLRAWIDGAKREEVSYEKFLEFNPEVSYFILPTSFGDSLKILWVGKVKIEDKLILFSTKEISIKELYPGNTFFGGDFKILSFERQGNVLAFVLGPRVKSSFLLLFLVGGIVTLMAEFITWLAIPEKKD
jgi:hypothetical protein